ncbi:MAG: ABC transporter ATP-binding protein [Pseudomonadota bacterium]
MEGVVDIHGLSFRWHAQDPIVLSLDALRIKQGERVFVEGPSGSGKSTLLSLLAGVSVPQKGEVRVLDKQLDRLPSVQRDHFRADHIGYIFQMFNLIPYLSMIDNVLLPCRFSNLRQRRALERSSSLEAEAQRLLAHLDMAHDDLLHRAVRALSVGQQQRVAAARALMGAPELLIADEPTSALDTDRREAFISLLFEECSLARSTLVFVSHDTSLEDYFDRTIRLAELNTAANTQTPVI